MYGKYHGHPPERHSHFSLDDGADSNRGVLGTARHSRQVKYLGAWGWAGGQQPASRSSFQTAWEATEEERRLSNLHETAVQAGSGYTARCKRTPSGIERLAFGDAGNPLWVGRRIIKSHDITAEHAVRIKPY